MPEITLKELLEAGVHFGHQTKKWNPKMEKYIFGERQGIHIVDLQKTMAEFEKAYAYIRDAVADGRNVLFVGTKKQAQEIIREEAERCGMSYVHKRWLGGTLTNFDIIKKSIEHLRELLDVESKGGFSGLSKRDLAKVNKDRLRLEKCFYGLRNMNDRPDIIFIVDPVKEKTALSEAKKVKIFTIGVLDTNGDPDLLDICIPGNDDAIRSIKLLVSRIADAAIEGKQSIGTVVNKEESLPEGESVPVAPEIKKSPKTGKKGEKRS